MKIARVLGAVGIIGAVALGLGGCEKDRNEMRPDMDKVVSGEHGLQSRDLREMTNRMAPDLLSIPEIANSPYKVVAVMKPIENKLESDPGRDLTIYVARLRTLLNSAQSRDRIAFVEEKHTIEKLQNEELGGNADTFEDASRGPGQPSTRLLPQYALWGTFYEKNEGKTSYYLCTFRMTNLKTGLLVWEGSYEVKTLN